MLDCARSCKTLAYIGKNYGICADLFRQNLRALPKQSSSMTNQRMELPSPLPSRRLAGRLSLPMAVSNCAPSLFQVSSTCGVVRAQYMELPASLSRLKPFLCNLTNRLPPPYRSRSLGGPGNPRERELDQLHEASGHGTSLMS